MRYSVSHGRGPHLPPSLFRQPEAAVRGRMAPWEDWSASDQDELTLGGWVRAAGGGHAWWVFASSAGVVPVEAGAVRPDLHCEARPWLPGGGGL